MSYKLIAGLILTGMAVLFVVQNVAVVEVHFLFWTITMSRALMIFFLLAIGILIGWLLHSYVEHKRKRNEPDT